VNALANVVITGSTRGIGLGLAKEFRRLGHSVVISSRGNVAVAAAVAEVAAGPGGGKVVGQPCDVSQRDQVQVLWDAAAAALGSVDIWINNAGLGGPKLYLPQLTQADIKPVIATNVWGTSWAIMP
jgi:NAD(P)-dependent dehydrogenase (short-subunit alcohol dehydrogenase family)